jgi:pyruvate/2-oxoglutarate dehydrogenase complex dihydrolipoamide dehydrogenase (E3) component/uncharacterized membrane protein YdjX (TVP38/TMEM64 family)
MNKSRLVIVLFIVALVAAFFLFDIDELLTLESLRERQAALEAYVEQNLLAAAALYFIIYVAVTGLSIPGAAVMTLVAGFLFGLLPGTIVVSFASTIGATLAFLLSRFLLRDVIENRFGAVAKRINAGLEKDGPYYLFALRLVPAFPFFAINLAMGLTRLPTVTFYWVSQLGMLAGTIVYVNAGTQLSRIESTGDILSPQLLGSFVLLGLFPILAKKTIAFVAGRRRLSKFPKPKKFDANMVVIGAGSAGLVSAYIASASKARVVLIERNQMGGDCLNTGCVPSKALIRSARIASYFKRAGEFGLHSDEVSVDFPAVMQRVQDVIDAIEPHDSVERYTKLGVQCVQGEARITSPWSVEVGGRSITTRSIVIATGGSPFVPPIPGLAEIDYLTSDSLWSLGELPPRLLVLGGGPIGCEMAQAFRRLGSEVTLVEMLPRLLIKEDPEVSTTVAARFVREGITVLTGHRAERFSMRGDQAVALCAGADDPPGDSAGDLTVIEFDKVLVAVGRRAETAGLGLGELDIELNPDGTVTVNEYLQATYPNIFACGDAAGPYQLTHVAAHQAWYCAMNALFGRFKKFRVDYSVIPWAVFTDPEVARVGLSEIEAAELGVEYELTRYDLDDLDRAIADGEANGFVRVLTPPGRDKILGVTIVGAHAGDLITEFVFAMRNGLGLRKVLNTLHIYPTLVEANRFAAGAWQKAHLSPRLIRIAEWYHRRLRR